MRNPASLPAFLALALGLAGCLFDDDKRVAGGAEDFPNTLAALGGATSGSLSAHAEWDQFDNIPEVDLAPAESLVTAPLAAGPMAAKAAAAKAGAADTAWDYSDTATLGVARRYVRDEGTLRVRADTTVYLWDDKARDGVRGNETVLESRGGELRKAPFNLKTYRFQNLDSAGGFDRATFYEADLRAATEILRHTLIVTGPGPDGDFAAKADNRPEYFATARTRGDDTLDVFEVRDADGDGRLWGEGDSGVVDVRRRQTDPLLRPAVALSALRAMLFKSGLSYPIAYSETRIDRDGKQVAFSVKGRRGGADSTFGPGDTVIVTVKTTPSPEAEVRFLERTGRFRIRLADTPGQYGGNALLHFSMETRWREGAFRKGAVVSTRLAFTPDAPVTSGNTSVTGEVRVEAVFADGSEGLLEGRYADRRLTGNRVRITGGDRPGEFRVVWDASEEGTILEQEKLPESD